MRLRNYVKPLTRFVLVKGIVNIVSMYTLFGKAIAGWVTGACFRQDNCLTDLIQQTPGSV
jgi:hypothetical protein